MAFVLVFVLAMLVIPVMMDVERHGADNIFRKCGEDILRFRWVIALQGGVRAVARVAISVLLSIVGVVILLQLLKTMIAFVIRNGHH
jgi:hypothetical protein